MGVWESKDSLELQKPNESLYMPIIAQLWARWLMFVIPALGMLRLEGQKVETSLRHNGFSQLVQHSKVLSQKGMEWRGEAWGEGK